MSKFWKCGICKLTVKGESAACIKCRQWVHLKCTKSSLEEVKKKKGTFECINCQRNNEVSFIEFH